MNLPSTPTDRPRATREVATLAILALVALGFSLQQSLVVPALTTIQRELHAGPVATTWLVTGFLLSSSVATPIVGRLGDMYGRKTVMLLSLVTLAVGTVLAGTATSIGMLVGARILQGFAGAIVPLSFGIARDELPLGEVVVTVAAALGSAAQG